MIFVTVGSMFPFDRLIRAMDALAAAEPGTEVFAQIGGGAFEPAHMRWVRRLDQAAFARTLEGAELVVAHAGVGSVILAGEAGKPIVLLPRRHAQGEHTTDHQAATANWLRGKPGIHVAADASELGPRIADARAGTGGRPVMTRVAPAVFLARLRAYLRE